MTALREIETRLWAQYEKILKMNGAQRAGLRHSLKRLTSTNCSWFIYDARPMLLEWLNMVGKWKRRKR